MTVRRNGLERRFHDGHDRKVDGFTPIQASQLRTWIRSVMGFRGFARVRANPFLECQDNQRIRSCFFLQISDFYEGTCC